MPLQTIPSLLVCDASVIAAKLGRCKATVYTQIFESPLNPPILGDFEFRFPPCFGGLGGLNVVFHRRLTQIPSLALDNPSLEVQTPKTTEIIPFFNSSPNIIEMRSMDAIAAFFIDRRLSEMSRVYRAQGSY